MRISVVVLVYNEIETIAKVLERVMVSPLGDHELEVVVVDDCSTDGTREVLTQVHGQRSRFGLILSLLLICHKRYQLLREAVLWNLACSAKIIGIVLTELTCYDSSYPCSSEGSPISIKRITKSIIPIN